jgi:hypothetical protein
MTFTEILTSDASAKEKLTQLSGLVAGIRKAYGNSDIEIDVPYVPTPDGIVSFKYLDDESKVVLAGQEVRTETVEAVEICEATQGAMFDKEFEALIATNDILCNLEATTGSQYI